MTFVNEFLAIPWLRSRGNPIRMIDDDEVERRRRALMAKQNQFSALRQFVQNRERHANLVGSWFVASPEFAVLKSNGEPAFKTPGRSASQLKRLVEMVVRDGYHRFAEMFTWAGELMDKIPGIINVLRDRFPMLFLDEAQDNSEEQSVILHRIFTAGGTPVILQRLGDDNQAIFNFVGQVGATTAPFPDNTIPERDLPNSHRFGQNIADLADPLGVVPCGLVGHGPRKPLASGSPDGVHTVFLFDEDSVGRVLDAYGQLLIETFSEQELREGVFTAIGQVHKLKGDDRKPRHVGHYWPDYDPDLAGRSPKPRTFVQYLFAGQAEARGVGESYPSVEGIAEGILRLAAMESEKASWHGRRRRHRFILQLLENEAALRARYKILIARFGMRRKTLTKSAWENRWHAAVRKIAEGIAGESLSTKEAACFLEWNAEVALDSPARPVAGSRDNIYRYPDADPKVQIRAGSIHSAKGETHTATLVLETFWNKHNLDALLPWLSGSESGCRSAGQQQATRLKLHYVAMTRPTHLLCLAMKRSSFENEQGELDEDKLGNLERRGWRFKAL